VSPAAARASRRFGRDYRGGMSETENVLQAAIERVHGLEPGLEGMRPARWLLVLESEDEHARTVSVMQSGAVTPWDALGLLRFATLEQEAGLHTDLHETGG
jgi:hypothetical protein